MADQGGSRGWVPNKENLQKVCQMFRDAASSDNQTQQMLYKQMKVAEQQPAFMNYLAFIFNYKNITVLDWIPEKERLHVQSRAGLRLKNNAHNWDNIPVANQQYVLANTVVSLQSPNKMMRKIVGMMLIEISRRSREGLSPYPHLMRFLLQALDSSNPHLLDGAVTVLEDMFEEVPQVFESEALGRPLNALLPKLISLFNHPDNETARKALGCCVNLTAAMITSDWRSNALMQNMNVFLNGLFALASKDRGPTVKRKVCLAFRTLLEFEPRTLEPQLSQVIQFMLKTTYGGPEPLSDIAALETRIEACEFWSTYCDSPTSNRAVLKRFLDPLVRVLLRGMVYSQAEIREMGGGEDIDNSQVPDKQEDIAPTFHKQAKNKGMVGTAVREDDDEWEGQSDWTLRKCSAASLDSLSTVYQASLLPYLLGHVQGLLRDNENWKRRESGVLALGAVAEGCYKGMEEHLPKLVPYLTRLLQDPWPLVRSITCWTLSRYSRWIVLDPDDSKYFRPLMIELLKRILDKNKQVQEAACSSFATLEEHAQHRLMPYLETIIKNLMYAFQHHYKQKNMPILYDAIGTLAEAVGENLNAKPAFVPTLMGPLFAKWQQLRDDDTDIFPLLECLTSIAQAVGSGFHPYAMPVFNRCTSIIEKNLIETNKALKQQKAGMDVELPNREFVVCALDLLAGLAEGLEGSVESLVARSNVLKLLFACIKHRNADVRQSAFALLGELAKACISHLNPHLREYLPIAAGNLDQRYLVDQNCLSVCNNASWAIGEIAMKTDPKTLEPFIPMLMNRLVPIVNDSRSLHGLSDNTAITMGRLALVCPTQVAEFLPQMAHRWLLFLTRLPENPEKDNAFKGLLSVIQKKPKAILPAFPQFCLAIAKWQNPSKQMQKLFKDVLVWFRSQLGQQNWEAVFGRCDPKLREYLTRLYLSR